MIPLVSANREVELVKARIDAIAAAVQREQGATLAYRLGVMVETPRAALRAGDLAASAAFLSLRHQRPDADDLRPQPRRRRPLHARLRQPRRLPRGSVPLARPRGRGRADADRRPPRPRAQPRPGARPLRRARRRPVVGAVLQGRGLRLRLLLAVPGADRPARGGAGDDPRPGAARRRTPANEAARPAISPPRRGRQGARWRAASPRSRPRPTIRALAALLDAAWRAPRGRRARADRPARRRKVHA